MTPEEQDVAIRATFYNKDTIPHKAEFQAAIGKTLNLVQPRAEALLHAAADLINVNDILRS